MAQRDKRRGGEPYGPDARGLVTFLRKRAATEQCLAGSPPDIFSTPARIANMAKHAKRAAQLRANIRWVLAARRAVERAK